MTAKINRNRNVNYDKLDDISISWNLEAVNYPIHANSNNHWVMENSCGVIQNQSSYWKSKLVLKSNFREIWHLIIVDNHDVKYYPNPCYMYSWEVMPLTQIFAMCAFWLDLGNMTVGSSKTIVWNIDPTWQ